MNFRPVPGLGAGIALVTLLLPLGCGGGEEAPAGGAGPGGPAPTVVVATVRTETVPILRDFVARTEAVETIDIQARVEAILEKREFEEGKPVKKDQVLYRLDSNTYDANLGVAKAQLAQATANLKLAEEQVTVRAAEAALAEAKARQVKARQDVIRLRPLAEKDAVPKQDLDTAVAAEKVTDAEVDAAEATLENSKIQEEVGILLARARVDEAQSAVDLAQLDLDYCTITSPIDGLIGRTEVNVGNLVGRGESTLLATVSLVDPIYVTFSISEEEFLIFQSQGKVKADKEGADRGDGENNPIDLILADDSIYPHKGVVTTADRAVDISTGTLQLVAEFPNPDSLLRPGQFGRVRARVREFPDAILCPQRAVMEQQSAKIVLVVGPDNVVALRTVQILERHEDTFIIAEGLKAGDRVIVEGQLKARPGTKVNPTDQPLTSEPRPQGREGG